ncbi:hypothetical protein EIP75_10955 [Aquabacterium soli]|uniref:Uncharacterized protein n=1 Tax=Aquabacterium soli TaxID=2493092 RepID=A0A426VC21_9BURK|nr:FUSC family protein [Aquabacterium soli]RRS04398.1 hypothetical protein EIP75_10955 [Aquabacterium soli]
MQATQLTPVALARRLPAHLVNGLSVGAGLASITTAVALAAGLPAALTVSSGAAVVSIADTVAPPQAKTQPMLMAALAAFAVALLVALCHGHHVLMGLAVLLITFSAILWTAWGKRGGTLTFTMILSLVFQMAAFDQGHLEGAAMWTHVGWVALGCAAMAGWSLASGRVLAPRYQSLAVADSLRALARLIEAQADWLATLPHRHIQGADPEGSLLPLVRQQATIADVLQQTRDLLYSDLTRPGARRWIPGFIGIVDVRDLVLACQVDLDQWPADTPVPEALLQWGREMKDLAAHLDRTAEAAARHLPWPTLPVARDIAHTPLSDVPLALNQTLLSLLRRHAQMRLGLQRLRDAVAVPDAQPLTLDTAVLQSMRSPVDWPLANLRAVLSWRSPVLRHAARTTAAMACAYLLAHSLPWTAHPQWMLMTVAVVLRGNLEQTLARRDARVIGTLAGCLLASLLLALQPNGWVVLAVLALALSIAHAYALVDYRITSMAGAVLALLQVHVAHGHMPSLAVLERLGDTLVGAGLAWGFSYLWPAWERHQLPQLVGRLLRAEARYAHHVMGQGVQSTLGERGSHARREVYDVVWLLTQSLQRMQKEPSSQRAHLGDLETVVVRSHRLTSQIAGVRGLLLARQAEFDPAHTLRLLGQADARMGALFGEVIPLPTGPTTPANEPQASPTPLAPMDDTGAEHAPITNTALLSTEHPQSSDSALSWLARRLRQAEVDAQALVQAARAFMA